MTRTTRNESVKVLMIFCLHWNRKSFQFHLFVFTVCLCKWLVFIQKFHMFRLGMTNIALGKKKTTEKWKKKRCQFGQIIVVERNICFVVTTCLFFMFNELNCSNWNCYFDNVFFRAQTWFLFHCFLFHFRIIQILAARTIYGMYFFGSFYNVKITGKQATSKEAPILALAPHSSFFDSIAVVLFGPPSVLAKAETASLPFLGSELLGTWILLNGN